MNKKSNLRSCLMVVTTSLLSFSLAQGMEDVDNKKTANQKSLDPGQKKKEEKEDPDKSMPELKALFAKYLPKCRLKALDYKGTTIYRVVDQKGNDVHNVPGWQMITGLTIVKKKSDKKYMGNPALNSLLKERKTPISKGEEALEVARLVIGLTRGSNWIRRDMWKYSVNKIDGGWLVDVLYIGPPAMISPRQLEVFVDKNSKFLELREPQPAKQ